MQKAEQLVQQQQQQLNTNPPLLKSKRIVYAADQHKPTNLKRQKDFLQQHNTIYPQSENQTKRICAAALFFLLEESVVMKEKEKEKRKKKHLTKHLWAEEILALMDEHDTH